MAPQSWLTAFHVLAFFGAFLVGISSIGTWYFGNKVSNEKDKKIAELVEGKNILLEQSNVANRETTELKRLSNLMLRGMENAGQVKLHRDSKGQVTGFVIELLALAKGEASASADLSTASNRSKQTR